MSTFKLYSPALVMLAWSLAASVEALGGTVVTAAGLAVTGLAVEAHVMETRARRRDPWVALRTVLRRGDDRRGGSHPPSGRRRSDSRRSYRDLWLFLITLLMVLALKGQHDNLTRIQHSRQAATAVTCQVMSAVTAAGRSVIEGSATAPETPFTRFLEEHGYPKLAQRRVLALVQAEAYAALVERKVASAVGARKAADLVDHAGQIDCGAFARLVRLGRLK